MGGVPTTEVVCTDYVTAAAFDKDIDKYISEGMMIETQDMYIYSWISNLMYYYGVNIKSYMDKIDAIIFCGIQNEVVDSVYANQAYFETYWSPIKHKI